jgi:hypothetical protein
MIKFHIIIIFKKYFVNSLKLKYNFIIKISLKINKKNLKFIISLNNYINYPFFY